MQQKYPVSLFVSENADRVMSVTQIERLKDSSECPHKIWTLLGLHPKSVPRYLSAIPTFDSPFLLIQDMVSVLADQLLSTEKNSAARQIIIAEQDNQLENFSDKCRDLILKTRKHITAIAPEKQEDLLSMSDQQQSNESTVSLVQKEGKKCGEELSKKGRWCAAWCKENKKTALVASALVLGLSVAACIAIRCRRK